MNSRPVHNKELFEQIEGSTVKLRQTTKAADSTSTNPILRLQGEIESANAKACLKNVTPPGETSFAKLVKLQAEIKSEKAKEHLKPVKVVGEDVTLQRAKLQGQIVSHKVKEQLKTVKPVEDIAVQRAKLQNEIVSDKAKQQLRQVKSPGESQFTRIVKLQGEIRKGTRLKPSENREEM